MVGRRLEERYPDAHFKFIDAAIGGTDSGLGIFRLERDVMPCKPDIVFVEWLVNDGERKADDDCSCSYEGIVRHILERLPGCVPVQVMLPTRGTIEEPDAMRHGFIGDKDNRIAKEITWCAKYSSTQLVK